MPARFAPALAGAFLTLVAGLAPALAHEGHDHTAAPAPSPATAAPRASASTQALELVAIARGGRVIVFLDRLATNEPVTGAQIAAETPEGTQTVPPLPDGSYGFDAHWSTHAGEHDVVFTVVVDGASDVFPLALAVPAPPPEPDGAVVQAWAAGLAITHDFERHLVRPDPLLVLIGGGGFLLGIGATLLVRRRARLPAASSLAPVLAPMLVPVLGSLLVLSLAAGGARAHEGHEHAGGTPMAATTSGDSARRMPDGSIFVPKPTQRVLAIRTIVTATDALSRTTELPGRVIADPNGSGVVQSSVGGRLAPPESGLFPRLGTRVAKGETLATVTPPVQAVDVSDMRQRQGELDQQIAIVERRVERYRRLASGGTVSQVQLEDTLAELKGLQDRRAALDAIRLQPEALRAPVDGVIAEANAVAGQMASPGQQIFQIVDPDRLWVEALSFDAPARGAQASARLADGRRLSLTFMGAGLADRSQAVPVQFAIQEVLPELRIGQFVTVLAETEAREAGLALPRASVVRGADGQSVAYAHTAPERFEPRAVRVAPLDAERVRVISGLDPGLRIVTQGAELLDQVR